MMEYLQPYIDHFFSMGVYAYFIIAFFVVALIMAILSVKFQKNAKDKWLAAHPGAVKVDLVSGQNFITAKDMRARILSGEAALFLEKAHYAVWAVPGDIVLEVTYTYTRPGVLHKNVSTTWGPAKVELHLEREKEYALKFDRKEERFVLEEVK